MSIEVMSEVWLADVGDPTRKLVLLALADNANLEKRSCFASVKLIARKSNCSPKTVRRHIKALSDQGWIEVETRHTNSGRQTTNLYTIAPIEAGGQSDPLPAGVQGEGVTGDQGISLNHHNKPSPKRSPSKQGTRIPESWQPDEDLITWAVAEAPHLNIEREIEIFRDYWLSKSGANATKVYWCKTFKNWIRNEVKKHGHSRQNRKTSVGERQHEIARRQAAALN